MRGAHSEDKNILTNRAVKGDELKSKKNGANIKPDSGARKI